MMTVGTIMASIALLLLVALMLSIISNTAMAHMGSEGESAWIISSYTDSKISLTADDSLAQWKNTRMLTMDSLDKAPMTVMSVHNKTYLMFLIQRPLNTPMSNAGIIVAFEGAGENGTDVVWTWVNGSLTSNTNAEVSSEYSVEKNMLIVTFGRGINSTAPSFNFPIGVPKEDFIKITSWSNNTNPESVDLESLNHMGLELLPFLNIYPKSVFIYSAILLAGTFSFIVLEYRRYR